MCWHADPQLHLCPFLRAVLRRKNSYKLSLWMLPLFAFITVYIGCY